MDKNQQAFFRNQFNLDEIKDMMQTSGGGEQGTLNDNGGKPKRTYVVKRKAKLDDRGVPIMPARLKSIRIPSQRSKSKVKIGTPLKRVFADLIGDSSPPIINVSRVFMDSSTKPTARTGNTNPGTKRETNDTSIFET